MAAASKIVSIGTGLTVTAKSVAGVWRSVASGDELAAGEEVKVQAASAQYARAAYILQRKVAGVWTNALTVTLDLPTGHSHFRQDKLTIAGDTTDSTVVISVTTDKGHTYLRRALTEMQRTEQRKGGLFTYKSASYWCSPSDFDNATDLKDTGFGEVIAGTLMSTREQWETAGISPESGQLVTYQGAQYRIEKVEIDEISYTLTLGSKNK